LFCVECGREGELIDSVCRECYGKKHVLASLPDHVDVALCAHCSSMLTDKGWKDVGSVKEAAEIAVEQSLVLMKGARIADMRVSLDEKDERNLDAKVSLLVVDHGIEFPRELGTMIRLKRGSCTECSKQQGRYYEAILQVRGPERSLPERREKDIQALVNARVSSLRKSSREVFISKTEQVKGGLDFYFSTISSAKGIAKELQESMCAEYKESSSLWGRRDGKDIYRMTFLVRLLGFEKGDVVEHKGRAYFVRGLSRGVLHGIDLSTGEERAIKVKDASECSLLKAKMQTLKAVVVSETQNELQVLDPETMESVQVRKYPGFSRKGERVRLVKTKLGPFVLSDSW